MIIFIVKTIFSIVKSKKYRYILAFLVWSYLIFWFASTYYLQSPIKNIEFQCVVCKRSTKIAKVENKPQINEIKRDIEVSKEVVEEKNDPLEKIYQQTRHFESNSGNNPTPEATHNYCKGIGKVNEIGYFPNGDRKFCFEDEKEQKLTFFKWLSKRIDEGHTIKESVCYYVTGTYMPMCQRTIDMGL